MRELREIRLRRGLSQADLSTMTGVAEFTISEIESGKRANPRPSTLRKLAHGLGVEVADLYGEPDSPLGQAPPSSTQPPLNGFEEERRSPSLRSWIDFARRTADRWEAEFEEREAEWQAAEPHIRKNVKWLPNLSWAMEILRTYTDVLKATGEELNYGLYVYDTAEAQELFKATRRLEEIVERTKPWYQNQGKQAPRLAEVIDLQRAMAERVAQITARSSQSA